MDDEQRWVLLIDQMKRKQVVFLDGLSAQQLTVIEHMCGFIFPPDLRLFLHCGVPISIVDRHRPHIVYKDFPNWHDNPKMIMESARRGVLEGFFFDIEHNTFWMSDWGEKPANLQAACAIAEQHVLAAPSLIPIMGHRYLPATPKEAGNPVFSMVQPHDVIYFGCNLEDHLYKAFLNRPLEMECPTDYRTIPFWSALVDRSSETSSDD